MINLDQYIADFVVHADRLGMRTLIVHADRSTDLIVAIWHPDRRTQRYADDGVNFRRDGASCSWGPSFDHTANPRVTDPATLAQKVRDTL